MFVGAGQAPRAARAATQVRRLTIAAAPSVVDYAATAQKETQGTQNVTATLGVSTAGLTLISIDAVRTAIRSAAPALNNGNTLGAALFTEAYTPDFGTYSIVARALASAAGGSNHSSTLTKSATFAEEATVALLATSFGAVTATSVVRNAAGAGATLTSATFTVAAGSRARCFALWSGTGNVNATPPTATIIGAQWGSPLIQIAFGSGDAPNGHIPLSIWAADFGPGSYTWQAQTAIDEGAVMATLVVQ